MYGFWLIFRPLGPHAFVVSDPESQTKNADPTDPEIPDPQHGFYCFLSYILKGVFAKNEIGVQA